MLKYENFAECYEDLLKKVMYTYDYETSPRGLSIREKMYVDFMIEDPSKCLFINNERSTPLNYLAKELILYYSAVRDVELFAKASPFWKKIANDDGTVNSAYGDLIFNSSPTTEFTQFAWAIYSITQDAETRQAIIHFNRPEHQYFGVKDFPCTLYGIFHIRDNKLNFKISMRSNDMIKGLTFDVPFFCSLQMYALNVLRLKYPSLELGTYVHSADSLHIYENDFDCCKKMLSHRFTYGTLPSPMRGIISNPDLMRIFNGEKIQNNTTPFIDWLISNIY